MLEMYLIFCCAGIGEILSGDAASMRNPGESAPGSLISNLRTEWANKKLKDWSDNLESAASLLDQSDEEGDSTMDHSGIKVEGKQSTAVPSEDPMSGGKTTKGATDVGVMLAAAANVKSVQPKSSTDSITVSGSSKAGGKYLAVRKDKLGRTSCSFRTLQVETLLKIKQNFNTAPFGMRVTIESS